MKRDLETLPGHLIRRLNQRSTAVFQKRIKHAPVELTSVQFAALDALSREPGMDQAQLAARIAYDRATIGDVVKRLVQKGLVARAVSETDRRARSLHLTPEGTAALEGARPVVTRLQAEILEGLSEEEAAQFIALARKAVAPQD
ncbi:MarR family winged helix-turn-helix transcriptional regulator [Thioclava sp. F28-4]|uniref:MarR family winged helix-turn-helix transcriptional regulator n=1 Tax=Thioclava sp. F28-4 TaxID=1915315 RepID=UPI0009968529|nr:MarR family transcriptional regulator [Thioclava sp. F28-4]OOY06651.1 MarR family transcriptional regulator [Thioclava sp. F28-4]